MVEKYGTFQIAGPCGEGMYPLATTGKPQAGSVTFNSALTNASRA